MSKNEKKRKKEYWSVRKCVFYFTLHTFSKSNDFYSFLYFIYKMHRNIYALVTLRTIRMNSEHDGSWRRRPELDMGSLC